MRNGYKVTVYLDDNPYSPTYMQTYEVREYDDVTCPIGDADLILISDTCEIALSGYTGYRIRIYQNTLTGEIINEKVLDPTCDVDTDEIWVNYGEGYCEVDSGGTYTGYYIQPQRQINPNAPHYDEIREQRYFNPDCSEDIQPHWEYFSKTCHIAIEDCSMVFDGTADIVEIDTNPKSPTYNTTRTRNVEDEDCANCADVTFKWVDIGEMCGDAQILVEHGVTAVKTTKYFVRRRYKTIGGVDYPMNVFDLSIVEEHSEDCGYVGPEYRWVVVGEMCDYETHSKYKQEAKQVSYDEGTTWAYVSPMEYRRGDLIQEHSPECGEPIYQWIDSGEVECSPIPEE